MKQKAKILILDDDNYVLLSLRILLEQHYTDVRGINNPAQLSSALEENVFDIVVLDMNFTAGDTSGKDGLKYLQQIKEANQDTAVLLLTAYGEIDLAVEAMRLGAFDFLVKPWENEKLLASVKTAFELNSSAKKIRQLESGKSILMEQLNAPFDDIIGESNAIQQVFRQIEKVAGTNANVLITGENGTGKELVARAIHNASSRSGEVFLNVDMGAISESLFESELFGHKKGSFTDAREDRIGKFEGAQGGTLFLDEIGNLPLSLQAKLLRVIQEQKVTRIGENKSIDLDIRLICATNAQLDELVKNEEFRQDLLFRINTIEIHLPPLRERSDDIPLLAKHFLDQYKQKYKKAGLFIPDYIFARLSKYDWPGNIRELQHAIERAVIMSDGKQLQVSDFNLKETNEAELGQLDSFNLDDLEKWAIESAIKKHQGNVSHAAKELGLSRGALYRRMEKHDI
ncbi:sigma-54-dependent transcriptional regulator [Roseivirga sp.]|uniref:sigma-54-dependent transcriptional regulator n=1 Tax=Roseivirga sp. TaxID=1964215 RepID=UPI003B52F7AF